MNIGSDVDFSFDQDIDRHAVPALKVHPKVLGHSAEWAAPGRCRMRPDARRFENWEFNHAAVLGLGAAVDYALAWGLPAIEARVTALAADLRARLAEVPGVTVTDLGVRRCGTVTFPLEGKTPSVIQAAQARKKALDRQS